MITITGVLPVTMMNIQAIPAFEDNYIWLIPYGGRAAVVDPGDAAPVINTLVQLGLTLGAILITHHHRDHTGGIADLLDRYPGARVYGPANEQIPHLTSPVHEGDTITLGKFQLTVLEVPGHTIGHIAYSGEGALFCGDTLFTAGCGGLFGGTAQQLHNSLNKIKKLPINTLVYCAHEYTLSNLRFAQTVEPNNRQILQRRLIDEQKRQRGESTVPATLALELETNPFLRCDKETVQRAARAFSGQALDSEAEVFRIVRYWKDTFA